MSGAPIKAKFESCVECKLSKPDVCCLGCQGRFYHEACFNKAKRHRSQADAPNRMHDKVPIELLKDLTYINLPNEQTSISDQEIRAAKENQFIAVHDLEQTLTFGPRAVSLIRPPPDQQVTEPVNNPSSTFDFTDTPQAAAHTTFNSSPDTQTPSPYPSFISFLGDTGTGKSWILRSLLRKFPHYPAPLASPGKVSNVAISTSSDINLYADGETSSGRSPILFLDFEGLNGTDFPRTYTPHEYSTTSPDEVESMMARRRHYVEIVYPRLAYAFSDCIVFLTTSTMQSRESIAQLIASFVNAAHGSRHQSFKPTLIIVYNKFANDDPDWSETASTAAFLDPANSSEVQVKQLRNYFDPVRVIKIPSSRRNMGHIAVAQLDELGKLLREEHRLARKRRVRCYMRFQSRDLMRHLSRALRIFSHTDDQAPVFDWVIATRNFSPTILSSTSFRIPALASFWNYCLKHWRDQDNLHVESFKCAWISFTHHFKFFILLYVHRNNGSDMRSFHDLARDIERFQSDIAELDVPCAAILGHRFCGGTRGNHRPDLHESADDRRWDGQYRAAMTLERLTTFIPQTICNEDRIDPTVLDSPENKFLHAYLPYATCVGCLFLPVAVTLSCKHPFCETCVKEIVGSDRALHHLTAIRCPFCSGEKVFSPRFLPDNAGYRVLSLGAGGARGISMIRVLESLETQCFGIPTRYLFDYFIGAGVGGLVALTVASTNPPLPLGMKKLEDRFRNLIHDTCWEKVRSVIPAPQIGKGPAAFGDNIDHFFECHDDGLPASPHCSPHVAFTSLKSRFGPIKSIYARWRPDVDPEYDYKDDDLLSYHNVSAAKCAMSFYSVPRLQFKHSSIDTVNWVAKLGLNETTSIWPTKNLDILVILGSGFTDSTDLTMVVRAKDWELLEPPFPKSATAIFRLDPVVSDIELGDVHRIAQISRATTIWLQCHHEHMVTVANHLVAGLFFYTTLSSPLATNQYGEISCRLPWDLKAREKLVTYLIDVARRRRLFNVTCNGARAKVDPLVALTHLHHGQNLIVTVDIEGVLTDGQIKLDIAMADIFGVSDNWYPISGSPYVYPLSDTIGLKHFAVPSVFVH